MTKTQTIHVFLPVTAETVREAFRLCGFAQAPMLEANFKGRAGMVSSVEMAAQNGDFATLPEVVWVARLGEALKMTDIRPVFPPDYARLSGVTIAKGETLWAPPVLPLH